MINVLRHQKVSSIKLPITDAWIKYDICLPALGSWDIHLKQMYFITFVILIGQYKYYNKF